MLIGHERWFGALVTVWVAVEVLIGHERWFGALVTVWAAAEVLIGHEPWFGVLVTVWVAVEVLIGHEREDRAVVADLAPRGGADRLVRCQQLPLLLRPPRCRAR